MSELRLSSRDPGMLLQFLQEHCVDITRTLPALDVLDPLFRVADAGRFTFLPRARMHDEASRITQTMMEALRTDHSIHLTFRPALQPFAHMPKAGSVDWYADVSKVFAVPLAQQLRDAYPHLVRPSSTSQALNLVHDPEHVAYGQVTAMVRYCLGAALECALAQSAHDLLTVGTFAEYRLTLWKSVETLLTAFVIAVIRNLPERKPLASLIVLLPECIPAAYGFGDPEPWQVFCGE